MRYLLKKQALRLCCYTGRLFRLQGVPILGYHSVDNTRSPLSTPTTMFKAQMGFLFSKGMKVISLHTLTSLLNASKEIPQNAVVLTFDDGFRSFCTNAWPLLAHLGFSATVFIPTNFIGGESSWYADFELVPMPMMDWSELKELKEQGADIQSHGCSHRNLAQLCPAEIRREVVDSKHTLEDRLGKEVGHFCYPFGAVNEVAKKEVKEAGYQSAVSTRRGLHRMNSDPYLIRRQFLDRIRVEDEDTAVLSMQACLRGTFAWYCNMNTAVQSVAGFRSLSEDELR